jgi:tetratricopeptide (TPR) repeat protein
MPTVSPPARDAAIEARVFWIRFQKEIGLFLVLALLAGAAYAGYTFYADRRDGAAATALAAAKTVQDYQQVIDRYASAPSGASAYLLLAEVQRKDKKLAEANKTLQAFVNKYPQHELVPTARVAMAGNLAIMGQADEALSSYQKAAASFPKSYMAPFALIAQVELLKTKGRTDEARRVCEQIITNYRESIVVGEATRQLRSLRPAPAAEAAAKPTITPPGSPAPAMLARPPAPAPANAPMATAAPSAAKPK